MAQQANADAIQALIAGQQQLQQALQAQQQQLQAQQQQFLAAIQAMVNAQQPAQQQQQVATIALTPALAQTGTIDYSSKAGASVYKAATAPLETEFNFSSPNTRLLLQELSIRAVNCGWMEFLQVQNKSLLTMHTQVTLDDCKVRALAYLSFGNTPPTRLHQLDHQLFECLSASLDPKTRQAMFNEPSRYEVEDTNNHVGDPVPSGLCFLKVLLTRAEADSKIVAAQIRRNISKLDEKLGASQDKNIKDFNNYIREQMTILNGMSEAHKMSDFEVTQFLFDAYKSCPDTEFVAYMKRLEDRHNDPDDTLTFEPTGLLTRADTFYENALARDLWMKKTADQQDIVALQASVARLQSALKKQKTTTTTPKGPGKDGKGKKTSDKKTYVGKRSDGRPDFKGPEAWKLVAPKPGEPHKKTVGNQEFKYCSNHRYWAQHLTSDCKSGPNPYKKKAYRPPRQSQDEITAALANIGIQDCVDDEEQE